MGGGRRGPREAGGTLRFEAIKPQAVPRHKVINPIDSLNATFSESLLS